MNKTKAVVLGFIAALAPLSASLAVKANDITSPIGTWELNVAESIAPQGRTFAPYKVVVRRADSVLDFTYYGKMDGEPYQFTWRWKADGTVRDLGGGMKGTMIRLPGGNYAAKLWMANGAYEEKYCQLIDGGMKNLCLATITYPRGRVVFFKQVQDRQVSD